MTGPVLVGLRFSLDEFRIHLLNIRNIALSIQMIPTLGPKLCKHYLHWATWIPRVRIRLRGV